MITCPWCGTNYPVYQSNCKNCGGALPTGEMPPSAYGDEPPEPPPAPRTISNGYLWRLLFADGWWVAAVILSFIGAVFTLIGGILALDAVTAFVGVPFFLLGLALLGGGGGILYWRYRYAQQVVLILRDGDSTRGQITEVRQNYAVSINGQSPWIIRYSYEVYGKPFEGKLSTMKYPDDQLQVGRAARILYLADDPARSSIYPHP
jgi:hypothetical protein